MAATLAELKSEIVQIKAGVLAQKAQIADLIAQLAAGSAITQQDLEDLDASLDDIITVQGGVVIDPNG